ncbi:uncharacterized protein GIQ15_02512 [Arthroderma uncinatum]|uniref:uncharacterized protein n=1 Tax=Arthroderma uncinatum TaxID=74035 RepID=UPI00144AC161|nr:uncharacterized protein GIQ15_02512 [Arthroderma uncinatum]KAF3483188.1 hypothetical protein GIQ15_02512 [Arthroderma uncinatum]
MVARRQSCEDALGELTAMANKTMIATGRWFRRPDRGPHELKRHIPPAHEQFQRALDRLQQEIFLAKALLEKDYHAILEKKAALNRVQQGNSVPVSADAVVGGEQSTAPAASSRETVDGPPQSTSTIEPVPAPTTQPTDTQNQQSIPPVSVPAATAATATISPPLTTSAPVQPIPSTTETTQSLAMATGDAPDSLANDMILDLQPTDMAEPMAHTQSGISHTSGISSLLPGLESYANAGVEENIMDLLPATGQPNGQVNGQTNAQNNNQTNGQNNQNNNQNNDQNITTENTRRDVVMEDVPESNFDDLFVGAGDFGGDADDLMLNTAEMTELDDSWFQ